MQMPDKLREAVEEYRETHPFYKKQRAKVERGEVVVIVAPTGEAALVIITRQRYDSHINVILCHNVIEWVTEWDVIIAPAEWRPYQLVAQTDLLIPVKREFCTTHVGFVTEAEMDEIQRVHNEGQGAGMPLGSYVQVDPRRKMKEDERIRSLPFCNPVYREQLGWEVNS